MAVVIVLSVSQWWSHMMMPYGPFELHINGSILRVHFKLSGLRTYHLVPMTALYVYQQTLVAMDEENQCVRQVNVAHAF